MWVKEGGEIPKSLETLPWKNTHSEFKESRSKMCLKHNDDIILFRVRQESEFLQSSWTGYLVRALEMARYQISSWISSNLIYGQTWYPVRPQNWPDIGQLSSQLDIRSNSTCFSFSKAGVSFWKWKNVELGKSSGQSDIWPNTTFFSFSKAGVPNLHSQNTILHVSAQSYSFSVAEGQRIQQS